MEQYEMTIGIECHVQLATDTKLFSPADNDSRHAEPNSNVHPIDYGLPGMLPRLNKFAVELAVKAGKALDADVAHISRFDRKHYFYPDLPKGYQTTQMYNPIILSGYLDVPLADGEIKRVRIHHAHMEEDAGKLTHYAEYSLVDLNRAGTPLIEIVSEPDMHTAKEARGFATELYLAMKHAGVTLGNLYHGNMRFDVNVSVAKKGATELGKRAEVKNLNSFRSVEKAAEYEFARQVELLEKGETIVQETRGWDEDKQVTNSQRSKEDAQDYRYMPDADIPPIILTADEISRIQSTVPPLPNEFREAWKRLGLDESVVNVLLGSPESARLVQRLLDVEGEQASRRVALWFMESIEGQQDEENAVADTKGGISYEYLVDLSNMVDKNELSSTAAKTVFAEMTRSNKPPRDIAGDMNLLQENDELAIAAIVDQVLADPSSLKALEDIKAGNEKAIGFLVGQVMKKSAGKANPPLAQKLIRERL